MISTKLRSYGRRRDLLATSWGKTSLGIGRGFLVGVFGISSTKITWELQAIRAAACR